MTRARDTANLISGPVSSDRKTATPLIINGDMQIAQRGTSFTGLSSGANQTLDRFGFVVNEGTFTITQDSDVPTGQGFSSSLKIDCTTADTSITSDGTVQLYQRFEGQNLQMLKKGTSSAEYITIAFWVKSSLTGNFTLEVKDHDNNRLICSLVNISSADTWEKKVVAFPGDTTGALTNDNNLSLQVTMWLVAGSDYNTGTLATSWEAQNNVDRAVGNFNFASSTSNVLYTTGWQMEIGTFDANNIPDFQFEDRGTSLARCQRYCIVYGTGEESYQQLGETGISTSTTQAQIPFNHPTEMRGVPSLSNSGNLALGQGTSLIAMTAVAINTNADTRQSTGVIATVASGLTGHKPYRIDQHGSSSSIMIFDAEL